MPWLTVSASALRFGNYVANLAVVFAVLDRSANLSALGLVVGVRSVATVCGLATVAAVTGRMRRARNAGSSSGSRHLVIATSCVLNVLALGSLAALTASPRHGAGASAVFVAIAAVQAAVAAAPQPVVLALLPDVAGPELLSANGRLRLWSTLAGLGAPAAAGLVLDTLGCAACEGLAAAAIVGALAALARVPAPVEHCAAVAHRSGAWGTLRGHRWIGIVIAAFTIVNGAWMLWLSVLGPAAIAHHAGRGLWGLLLVGQGLGCAAGALVAPRLSLRRPLPLGLVAASATALPPFAISAHAGPTALAAAFMLCGFGVEVFAVVWNTALQEAVPASELAAVTAFDMIGSCLAIPVSQLAGAPLADSLGVYPALGVVAGIGLAGCLLPLASRDVRSVRLRASKPHAPERTSEAATAGRR